MRIFYLNWIYANRIYSNTCESAAIRSIRYILTESSRSILIEYMRITILFELFNLFKSIYLIYSNIFDRNIRSIRLYLNISDRINHSIYSIFMNIYPLNSSNLIDFYEYMFEIKWIQIKSIYSNICEYIWYEYDLCESFEYIRYRIYSLCEYIRFESNRL